MEYVFHKLTPVKEVEPGWFKLKWKPIKNGTYNLYLTDTAWKRKGFRYWKLKSLGVRFFEHGMHNGWGRAADGFHIEIGLFFCVINFWILYNIVCMREGASDVSERKPLDFINSKLK